MNAQSLSKQAPCQPVNAVPFRIRGRAAGEHAGCLAVEVRCPACGVASGHGIAIPPCTGAGWYIMRLGRCGHEYRLVPDAAR